jgi:hypothetical protein
MGAPINIAHKVVRRHRPRPPPNRVVKHKPRPPKPRVRRGYRRPRPFKRVRRKKAKKK